MALIEGLEPVFYPPVQRKVNTTRKLRLPPAVIRAKAERVSSHSTEVMVKITGFGKGVGHVKAHLDYVSRNGKVELETDRGEVLNGKEDVNAFFTDWKADFSDTKRHKAQRDTMSVILSMPEGTDPEDVRKATREFTKTTFGKNHEYVFALHTDEPHPHCHVTVKCLGFNGTRLNPRKADLQAWRETFAQKLRDQGVDAEATPRCARGVVKKAQSNVVRHIERGDRSHRPRVSKVRATKIKEAAQELTAEAQGLPVPAKPWEKAIEMRQHDVRRSWLTAADALEGEDKALASRIRAFVGAMPTLDTERQETKRNMTQRFTKQAEKKIHSQKPAAPKQPEKENNAKEARQREGKDVER
jgi:type IV secretory pathway VirD2 relaxase